MTHDEKIQYKGACIDCRYYETKGRFNPFVDECNININVVRFHGYINLEKFLTDFQTQNFCVFFQHRAHEEGNIPGQ